MVVSTRITYVLWLFFGWTGLHHLYLGRLDQAIVWFATLGGGCGIGWCRDYWRIPEYIKWCSTDKKDRKRYLQRTISKSKPECSNFRSSGMMLFGTFVSTALGALCPDVSNLYETDPVTYYVVTSLFVILRVIGNALGVYIVANIGEFKCSLFYPLITATISTVPLMYFGTTHLTIASSVTAWVTRRKGIKWRPVTLESKKSWSGRKKTYVSVCIYFVVCTAWLIIVAIGVYRNGKLPQKDGETIIIKDHIDKFLTSDEADEVWNSIQILYTYCTHAGVGHIFTEIVKHFDFTERIYAYKVLEVFPGTSQETISKRCRKLLAQYHPDRFKVGPERAEAEERFLKISKACALISPSRVQKTRDEEEIIF